MVTEKTREKTLEQIFSEKLAAAQKRDKPVVKDRKDVFSGERLNLVRESSDYTKYLNELVIRAAKDKKSSQPTIQEFIPENITEAIPDEISESPQPPIQKTSDADNHESLNEIVVYQQIINSLRAELAEYKSKLDSIQPEIIQYEQAINSLKSELVEYKYRQPQGATNEIPPYLQMINSLRTELAEYKNKMELMASERNQQSNVDLLRADLREHENRSSATLPHEIWEEDDISSLRAEISRLKRNLDLMILK